MLEKGFVMAKDDDDDELLTGKCSDAFMRGAV